MDIPENQLSSTKAPPLVPTFELTFRTIFDALRECFPYDGLLICSAFRRLIVLKDNSIISTIAINRYGDLYVNYNFWCKEITTKDRLKTILIHELLHDILTDTLFILTKDDDKEYQLKNNAANISMDSRINAYIFNLFPNINSNEFFSNFYNAEVCEKDFLNGLLKPQNVFTEKHKEFAQCYDIFYNEKDKIGNHRNLYHLVLDELRKRPKQELNVLLIGSHGDLTNEEIQKKINENTIVVIVNDQNKKDNGTESEGNPLPSDLADIIKEALMSGRGIGQSNGITTSILEDALNVTEKFDITRFKNLMIKNIFKNVRRQSRIEKLTPTSSPILPTKLFQSDIFRLLYGDDIVIWKNRKKTYKFNKMLLPIYLDVSGSTTPYLPEIIKLLVNIKDELDYVWGFSNEVVLHTKEDLKQRKISSTGGTDFDCVINHALENKFNHIVVITDGDAYTEHKQKVKDIKSVVTILFGYKNKLNYFSEHYGDTHNIEEVTT